MRRLTAAAGLLLTAMTAAQAAPDVTGLWLTDDGEAAVDVKACGAALCGTIAWLKTPKDAAGQPLRDANNPDAAARTRPLCGLGIFGGARPEGAGWTGGWIYDPDEGKRYSLDLTPTADGTLAVTGFVGIKALGQTVQWSRAPAGLPRCDAAAAKPRS